MAETIQGSEEGEQHQLLDMHARPTKKTQINLLKPWKDGPCWSVHVKDKPAQFPTAHSSSNFPDLKHLTAKLQKDLEKRMPEGLFFEKPGRTEVIQHDIHLLSPGPVHQTYCRVPARLIPALKREVQSGAWCDRTFKEQILAAL